MSTHTSLSNGEQRRPRRRITRAGALIGAATAAVALAPAAALASPTHIDKTYRVSVKPMALAHGSSVKANVDVTSPQNKVSGWWNQKTVSSVVRKGVNGGFQSPYQAQGFACTPVVKGQTTSFTCKLRGADVPTTVTIKFNVVYRGDTASG
jgi:hypothetical protein